MSDVTARLAEIRERVRESARLTPHVSDYWPVDEQLIADIPPLLAAVEAVLKLADKLEEDAARLRRRGTPDGPIEFVVERCDRTADLDHAVEDIRREVAAALNPDHRGDH